MLILFIQTSYPQDKAYITLRDIPYYKGSEKQMNEYIRGRCQLDITYPKDKTGFATVVWFHGGGLTGGSKELPEALKRDGICLVGHIKNQ